MTSPAKFNIWLVAWRSKHLPEKVRDLQEEEVKNKNKLSAAMLGKMEP